jgi:hypothetical protein
MIDVEQGLGQTVDEPQSYEETRLGFLFFLSEFITLLPFGSTESVEKNIQHIVY